MIFRLLSDTVLSVAFSSRKKHPYTTQFFFMILPYDF